MPGGDAHYALLDGPVEAPSHQAAVIALRPVVELFDVCIAHR